MSALNLNQISTQIKWNNSIFIPKMDFNVTKNQLKDHMEKNVGKVSRIDFVSFNSENGSGRRAFIHFVQWYNNDYAKSIRYNIETNGHFDMVMNGVARCTLRLLINKNPVPETEQTIQQVASNVDFMAEKIRIQEEEIQALKQTCENLIFYTSQLQLRMNAFLTQVPHQIIPLEDREMDISELQ